MMEMNKIINYLVVIPILLLASCGTFEIGIESNTIPEVSVEPLESPLEPIPTAIEEQPTAQPTPSDEQSISALLAEKLGLSIKEMQFSIAQNTGTHATGNVSNGYFLAAMQNGTWVIVYDGQATPPCQDIEQYGFPVEMVSECLDSANQLVVRSDGGGGDLGDVLAEHLGVPRDELNFTIMQDAGRHVMGYLPGGYFLAVKVDGKWQIVFDGNGTPYCAQVDLHDFPAYIVPECVDVNSNLVYRTDSAGDLSNLQSLDCGPSSLGASPGSVESVACNIQDGLRSRNISALLGYMEDPFTIGYWQSEGVQYTPQDFLILLPQLYNFNDPDYTPRLTFTTNRSQFPDLQGIPVEGIFGSDVNVVEVIYSQGWGAGGDEGALIYLTQDPAGDYKWHAILVGIR